MFSELIYTRCRQGIDILKGGRTIASDGFKVYSCSDNIINDDIVDLPFLFNVAQGKQTYTDPSFMDDAYLFISPDKGKSMMVNFHPIPFDRTATGDYSHRPGNFINQVYVGDFHEFYPYELFGSSFAWDAKERGEAFYYNTPPTALPVKSNIDDVAGSVLQDDISVFVSDGRKDAVAAAVAFLLTQYSLPTESRKYLVIQDEDAAKIELWIAAIQSAFSPRMASGLPFATRLDKFTNTNKYTVNLSGQYQAQMNLQDPNQRLRLRAMIVGVDERDRVNTAAVRQLANSPYAVLNGKDKTFIGEANTTHPYYKVITSHNEQHIRFCREFLQMLDLSEPHEDVMKLYEAYIVLDAISERTAAGTIASSLSVLSRYDLKSNNYLKTLYETIKGGLQGYLQENLASSFAIMNWLRKTASVVGDTEATLSFNRIVNKAFAESVFSSPQSRETSEFWSSIRTSAFFDTVATTLTNTDILSYYDEKMSKFTCDSWVSFLSIYLVCAQKARKYSENELGAIVGRGLYSCYRNKNTNNALQICDLVEKNGRGTIKPLLLKVAESDDPSYTSFCMYLLLQAAPELISSDIKAVQFCKELQAQGQGQVCVAVLQHRAKKLINAAEQEHFINTIVKERAFAELDLSSVFKVLDNNISLSNKGNAKVAALLQDCKPVKAICVNSAHICAAAVFEDKKRKTMIDKALRKYTAQGFPSVEDGAFVSKLIDKILSSGLEGNELTYVIALFADSNYYLSELIGGILATTTPKQGYEWNMLLYTMVKAKSLVIRDTIASECLRFKQPEKQLSQLEKSITETSLRKPFNDIATIVDEEMRKNAPQSKLGKLFGFMSGDSKKNK
jgi:hypothetical protein